MRAQVACELLYESSTFVPGEDAKDLLTAVTASTRVLLASARCLLTPTWRRVLCVPATRSVLAAMRRH